jgi:hypothetical protein
MRGNRPVLWIIQGEARQTFTGARRFRAIDLTLPVARHAIRCAEANLMPPEPPPNHAPDRQGILHNVYTARYMHRKEVVSYEKDNPDL